MSSKRRHSPKTSTPQDSSPQEEIFDEQRIMSEPSPEPKPIARQPSFEVDRIGDILRRVREHRGEDLESISDYLRIRPAYLIALENSRYEDLPADAYVIGFLRTYALYLGLDGKGAIDQYRREMAGRRRKPQLTMPQPMAEGRAPTIAVLVGAAIAALLVYGIWYGLSSPDPEAHNKAIPLPVTTTEKEPPKPAATEAAPQATESTLPAQTATSDGIALTVPVTAVPTTATTEGKTTAPATQDAPEAKAPPQETKPEPAKDNKETKPVGKEPKAELPAKDKVEATTKAKPEPAETIRKDIVAVPVAAPAPAPTPAPAATVSSDKTNKSHLTIKADKESWVLVTDSKGNTVYEKTLKPGESYSVPSNKGLRLTTGNASGMTFNLDGTNLPKMNSSDAIVRAIPLDPDKLKSRLTDSDPATDD